MHTPLMKTVLRTSLSPQIMHEYYLLCRSVRKKIDAGEETERKLTSISSPYKF